MVYIYITTTKNRQAKSKYRQPFHDSNGDTTNADIRIERTHSHCIHITRDTCVYAQLFI